MEGQPPNYQFEASVLLTDVTMIGFGDVVSLIS